MQFIFMQLTSTKHEESAVPVARHLLYTENLPRGLHSPVKCLFIKPVQPKRKLQTPVFHYASSRISSETNLGPFGYYDKQVYFSSLPLQSGLTAAVRASKISLSKAEETFLEFIKKHTPHKKCPLAGSSVHTDKRFLDKYMPRFMDHLHYRIVDVSTIKELCR